MKKLLLIGFTTLIILLGTIQTFAANDSASQISSERLSQIAKMAIHYHIEPQETEPIFDNDPIMQEIWSLRGIELQTYLDFGEAFSLARQEFDNQIDSNTGIPDDFKLTELALIAQQELFFPEDLDSGRSNLQNPNELKFMEIIQTYLQAVIDGDAEDFFSEQYKLTRSTIIEQVEKNNYRLYTYDLDVLKQLELRLELEEK